MLVACCLLLLFVYNRKNMMIRWNDLCGTQTTGYEETTNFRRNNLKFITYYLYIFAFRIFRFGKHGRQWRDVSLFRTVFRSSVISIQLLRCWSWARAVNIIDIRWLHTVGPLIKSIAFECLCVVIALFQRIIFRFSHSSPHKLMSHLFSQKFDWLTRARAFLSTQTAFTHFDK